MHLLCSLRIQAYAASDKRDACNPTGYGVLGIVIFEPTADGSSLTFVTFN